MNSQDFDRISEALYSKLARHEHLTLNLSGEDSQFIRWNGSKIRQTGQVQDSSLSLDFVCESATGDLRRCTAAISLQNELGSDLDRALSSLQWLREQIDALPVDPFAQKPKNPDSTQQIQPGSLLDPAQAAEILAAPIQDVDLAGIYSAGKIIVAMSNSAGLRHWFETENFSFDYSLYTPQQRAVKNSYAGQKWSTAEFEKNIAHSRELLALMDRPAKKLERGSYRAYLAPAALHEIINMCSWGCLSEGAIQQQLSPLLKVRSGEKHFSPLVHLSEDFSSGAVPRFNDDGEVAPVKLDLIAGGKLVNTLVSTRTAIEYGVESNAASGSEGLRCPTLAPGSLHEEEILKKLDTGLYLSNLHYLNWSDRTGGRITGMTRYACFWVEKGKIVAPIENMRFDESIFHFLGDALEDLTQQVKVIQENGTYEKRWLGSMSVPGALLGSLQFTL